MRPRSARLHAHSSRIAVAIAAAMLCAPLAACSAISGSSTSNPSFEGADSATTEAASDFTESGVSRAANRSIISTGSITVEVDDPQASVDSVTTIADKLGGYVESQTVSAADSAAGSGASLTIRVPSAKFDAAFEELSTLGNVLDENRSAADVTAQHVDLKARVAALEASVARLTDLMSGAATTSELIEAESALAARQAELDGLQAQLDALEDQVDESTIWVTLRGQSVLPGGPSNFWEGLLAGIDSLALAGAGALVLLGVLLPWLAIAAVLTIVIVLIVRAGRKRSARKRLAQAHAQTQAPQPVYAAQAQAPQPNYAAQPPMQQPPAMQPQPTAPQPADTNSDTSGGADQPRPGA